MGNAKGILAGSVLALGCAPATVREEEVSNMRDLLEIAALRIQLVIKKCLCSPITARRVAIVTATFALLSLTAISTARAQTDYLLCFNGESGTAFCLTTSAHGSPAYLSEDAGQPITFINRYVTSNGNAWWELQAVETGLCLNWAPAADTGAEQLFWDSCVSGDANELFYNHVAGQLISLAGNEMFNADSYLTPICPAMISTMLCTLVVQVPVWSGWTESPYS
jgi:hypothetical protein